MIKTNIYIYIMELAETQDSDSKLEDQTKSTTEEKKKTKKS